MNAAHAQLITKLNDALLEVHTGNLSQVRQSVVHDLAAAGLGYGNVRYQMTVEGFQHAVRLQVAELAATEEPATEEKPTPPATFDALGDLILEAFSAVRHSEAASQRYIHDHTSDVKKLDLDRLAAREAEMATQERLWRVFHELKG